MSRLGYRAALQWLVDNDDCTWLDDCEPSPAVTFCLLVDIYGVGIDKGIRDLRALRDSAIGFGDR